MPDEHNWFHQSVGFVVVEKPARAPLPWVELDLSSQGQKVAAHSMHDAQSLC